MLSSIQAYNNLQKHYDYFQDVVGSRGHEKRVDIAFTDVYLPDPNHFKEGYAEQCRVDWHIEVRADHEPFFSYAVLLNNNNEFDGYAIWFTDKDEQEHFRNFSEVIKKVEVRLENF
jgi:hypothetical protein